MPALHVVVSLCLLAVCLVCLAESAQYPVRGRRPGPGPGQQVARRPPGPAKRAYRPPPNKYGPPAKFRYGPPKFKRGAHPGHPHGPPPRSFNPYKFGYGPPRKPRNPGPKFLHGKPEPRPIKPGYPGGRPRKTYPQRHLYNSYGVPLAHNSYSAKPSPPPYASLPDSYEGGVPSTTYGKPHPTHGSPEPPSQSFTAASTASFQVSPASSSQQSSSSQPDSHHRTRPSESSSAPTSYVNFYKTEREKTGNDLYTESSRPNSESYSYKQIHYPSEGKREGAVFDSEVSTSKESWNRHKTEPETGPRYQTRTETNRGRLQLETSSSDGPSSDGVSNSGLFQAPKQTFGFVPYDNSNDDASSSAVASGKTFSMSPSRGYYVGTTIEHSPQTSQYSVLSPNFYDNSQTSSSSSSTSHKAKRETPRWISVVS